MEELIRISSGVQTADGYRQLPLESDFVQEVTLQVQDAGGKVYHQFMLSRKEELRHGWITPAEIIVALGSAGVFTTLYQSIASYFARNQNRELTLEKGKVKITIRGHSLPEEVELLKKLAPELLPKDAQKANAKK